LLTVPITHGAKIETGRKSGLYSNCKFTLVQEIVFSKLFTFFFGNNKNMYTFDQSVKPIDLIKWSISL
jgi:hypothetical protein